MPIRQRPFSRVGFEHLQQPERRAEDFVYLLLSETGIFTLGFFTRSTSALSSATLVTAIMLSDNVKLF